MEHRLLILGSVEDFTLLTKYAVEKGIYTVVADAFDGEAKQYASKSYTVNITDYDLMDQIIKYERIDHIITSFSDNLFEIMVELSERNNLPCFCPSTKVRYLRDKVLMKEMLKELDIPFADGQIINGSIDEADIKVDYPCVLKPLDGWGSKGMSIVNNYEEVLTRLDDSFKYSKNGNQAMLESINNGHELNVMSWIKDGNVSLIEFGDRETTRENECALPHQTREIFPSVFYDELEDKVKEYLLKVADYCDIKEGPLSMQFFYDNGSISVGEVAGRFFGLGQGIVPIINTIDVNQLLINMLYFPGENNSILKNENKYSDHCSVAFYILPKKGIVKNIGNVMDFKTSNCDEFRVYVKPGFSTTMEPWIVRIYAHFNTREDADRYSKNLYEKLYVPDLNNNNLVSTNSLAVYK